MVDTLFSLPEISLYCQLVALLHPDAPTQVPSGAFEKLWRVLREAMDELHRDNSLKARILADIPRYIRPDPALGDTLHRFRSSGKRLFLLTNSEPHYTEAVMKFLLSQPGSPYASWRDYFDLVITSARKPLFFRSDEPFLEVDDDMQVADVGATKLKRGGMYLGGNFQALSTMAGLQGEEVLYVGDHIYGDILRSKRSTSWRTAMVIPEMERDLEHQVAMQPQIEELDRVEAHAFQLELDRSALLLDGIRNVELNNQLKEVTQRAHDLEHEISHRFNPAWGQLFRDRAELSAFGAQSEDYACVYTSRVSNFRNYSPSFYFRSPRDRMAHELSR